MSSHAQLLLASSQVSSVNLRSSRSPHQLLKGSQYVNQRQSGSWPMPANGTSAKAHRHMSLNSWKLALLLLPFSGALTFAALQFLSR